MRRESRNHRVARTRAQTSRRRKTGRERSQRHGDLRLWITAAFLLAGSVASGYGSIAADPTLFGWSDSTSGLHSIAVQGASHLDARGVAEATGIARGLRLESIDTDHVEAQLELHPWISAAHATVLPDGTLVVRVQERQPAAWAADPEGGIRYIDDGGRPFARAETGDLENEQLPEITGAVAEELDPASDAPRLARAVALARLAADRGVPSPVRIGLPGVGTDSDQTGAGWLLMPRGIELEAWLGQEIARFPERVGRLARLLEDDPAHARRASQIDLRFSGRAFLRFAERGAAGKKRPSPDGAGNRGDSARMRGGVQTRPTG